VRLTLIKFNSILENSSRAHTGNVCPLEEREREFESREREESIKNWSERERD
jgi:hypothetical protein